AKYKGLYLNGEQAVLSYSVGGVEILDSPGIENMEAGIAFTRTFHVGPASERMHVRAFERKGNWKAQFTSGGSLSCTLYVSGGACAVGSISGDVWVVSGIDEKLEQLKWRRFATGLFQPLGLKIVDDKVYVLGRDQITRLHDLNNDGEADFYENFNNDVKVTTNGHAYTTCLETDPEGNFYYTKCGDGTEHGGTMLKVSKDGSKLEVFATGLRNVNGAGAGPRGEIT